MSNDQKLNPKIPLKLFLIYLSLGIATAISFPLFDDVLRHILAFDNLYVVASKVLFYITIATYVISFIYILFRIITSKIENFTEGDSRGRWVLQLIFYFIIIPIIIAFASLAILFSTLGEIRF